MRELAKRPGTGTATATAVSRRSRGFPAVPDQVPEARRWLGSFLPASPLSDEAVICLSELAANAIQHSRSARPGGQFIVHASVQVSRITVEVEDEGGPWAQGADPGHEHGRGLLIVAALASRWGVTNTTSGRAVWIEMDRSCPPAAVKPRQRQPREAAPMKGQATMPETGPMPDAEGTRWRMRAIADELSLAGLTTSLHESRTSIDVTATIHPRGQREIEAIVDEDAYIELRFWHGTDATPAQVAALINSAVTAITTARHP